MKPIFVHYLDHFHSKRAERNGYSLDDVAGEARESLRVCFLYASKLILPASSFFESPLARRIIQEHRAWAADGSLMLSASDRDLKDHFEQKAALLYDDDSPKAFRKAYSTFPKNPPSYARRLGSSLKLIRAAWHGAPTEPLDRIWNSVPDQLGNRAFIPQHARTALVELGAKREGVPIEHIAATVEAAYISGYATDLGAGLVHDLAFLGSPFQLPEPEGSIRFCQQRRRMRGSQIDWLLALAPDVLSHIRESYAWGVIRTLTCGSKHPREFDATVRGFILEQAAELRGIASRHSVVRTHFVSSADSKSPGRGAMYDIKPAVGILTALPHEYAAVYVMLDNPRERIEGIYKYCVATVPRSIGAPLPVVLGLMPDMGNNPASASAARLLIHFSSVAHLIMCGIAGGVPWRKDRDDDIRLGDIVVSDRNGVIQYDNTKLHPDGWQEVRSPPRPPGFALLSAAKELEVQRVLKNRPWEAFLARGAQLEGGVRPEDNIDSRGEVDAATSRIDPRRAPGKPRIFLGTIASANQLLKNVDQRNALADAFGVKAIEMEGSGIADAAWSAEAGYLVIRGVCDYCDEKKGDVWQTAAAVAAASYLRALLALLTTL